VIVVDATLATVIVAFFLFFGMDFEQRGALA